MDLSRALDGEERAVARQVLMLGQLAGLKTVRGLLLTVEEMTAGERRRVLDWARKQAGLATATRMDERRRFESVQRAAQAVTRSPYPTCAEATCNAIPVHPDLGIPTPVTVRRW